MTKHLLTLLDLSREEVLRLIERARRYKRDRTRGKISKELKGRSLGLLFEKPSTRTRVSFSVAMTELGGEVVLLDGEVSQLSRGESYTDTARVLSRYLHGVVVRTDHQTKLEELAAHATIPVINGLSDLTHPCQILADLMTIEEERGGFAGLAVAYVGDGNNLANSWMEAAALLGFSLNVSCPEGFEPRAQVLQKIGLVGSGQITVQRRPEEAVRGVHVIATDTWFSMGQQDSLEEKRRRFQAYQVNERLLSLADPKAIVLHCLPAHRGEEITDGVMDGPRSRVFQEAENRLHVQKAILSELLK